MSELIYHEVEPISRAEARHCFERGDFQQIANALLGLAYYDDDANWVQDICVRYLENENNSLKAIAATSLGHLARIHGRVDTKRVIPLLKQLKSIPEISGIVDDAIADIFHWMKLHRTKLNKVG